MRRLFLLIIFALVLPGLACSLSFGSSPKKPTEPACSQITMTAKPAATFTPLPAITVQPGTANTDEPFFISGDIPYTSPFFLDSTSEPFVMLEDQSGFIKRDQEYEFAHEAQVIGPVVIDENQKLTFSLNLPMVPQGQYHDLDNDGKNETGVQVFAVAYWSNTWRDPFLERRDGTGWSNAYASTITDPENDFEITGGTLVVWSPDDQQAFPTGFGADGLLFTGDDPAGPISAGYNLIDLDETPFRFYKESRPRLTLSEGVVAVNDFSEQDYSKAFISLFEKASREYPFTDEKKLNWQSLQGEFFHRAEKVKSSNEFYRLLRDFTRRIPDGHVGLSFNQEVFFQDYGGGLGLVLAELGNGDVIVTKVLPGAPADQAGIVPGAIITSWDSKPVKQAIEAIIPGFGPYSTEHALRLGQLQFLERMPEGTRLEVTFRNPQGEERSETLRAVVEYDSLFMTIPSFGADATDLPIESETLKDSGLVYVRINAFQDDFRLMAQLWDRLVNNLIDNNSPGLIIDLRNNGGGSAGMALNFAGYFVDQELILYQGSYYNENTRGFEPNKLPYTGPIAVLVSVNCASACEGFAYALQQNQRATIIGHTPTAGMFGEVGQGQYKLPDDLTMQMPTGRPTLPDGSLVIEGVGVIPDILVPVTVDSALGTTDTLLQEAIAALK